MLDRQARRPDTPDETEAMSVALDEVTRARHRRSQRSPTYVPTSSRSVTTASNELIAGVSRLTHSQACPVTAQMRSKSVSSCRTVSPASSAEVVEQAGREAVAIERYGRASAVTISPARYQELLDALEEVEDIAAFDGAMAEEGPNIPWEQVKADLGWQ
jgi:PHD/YefM family antitoxin component YafN of YafNO toxin-antitoxin module